MNGYAVLLLLGLGLFFANVALFRWVLRVNHVVRLLQSIDRSLQLLPAVREARAEQAGRRWA